MDDDTLQRIWEARQPTRRYRTIGELVSRLFPRDSNEASPREAFVTAIWHTLAPPELWQSAHVRSVRRGTITLEVADAATRFEVERVLGPELVRQVRSVHSAWGPMRLRVALQAEGTRTRQEDKEPTGDNE
ncbi:MAG: DUF721 domain-containing protein [Phycisphaerae bacterium]|nr:DUF721 domain-containing protein [Phycisphaerae bacterium]